MKGPNEKPLGLDMGFGEALRRFVGTDPKELAENVAAEKKRQGPPQQSPLKDVDGKPPKRPAKPNLAAAHVGPYTLDPTVPDAQVPRDINHAVFP